MEWVYWVNEPTVPPFKKTLKGKDLRLSMELGWYCVYCGNDLVNAYQGEWASKKNPKFVLLELLYGV